MERYKEGTMQQYEGFFSKITNKMFLTMVLAGAVIGHSIGSTLYQHPFKYTEAIDFVVLVLLFVPLASLLVSTGRDLRRWRSQLKAEREAIVANMKTRVDEMVRDPIEAARIKMELEAEWRL